MLSIQKTCIDNPVIHDASKAGCLWKKKNILVLILHDSDDDETKPKSSIHIKISLLERDFNPDSFVNIFKDHRSEPLLHFIYI